MSKEEMIEFLYELINSGAGNPARTVKLKHIIRWIEDRD